jgi:hypothetical protein
METQSSSPVASEKPPRETYAAPYIRGDHLDLVVLGNPLIDNIMVSLVNMGAENWILKRRLLAIESLLGKKDLLDLAALEAFEPTKEEAIAWNAQRDAYMKRIYDPLMRPTTGPVTGPMPSKVQPGSSPGSSS